MGETDGAQRSSLLRARYIPRHHGMLMHRSGSIIEGLPTNVLLSRQLRFQLRKPLCSSCCGCSSVPQLSHQLLLL